MLFIRILSVALVTWTLVATGCHRGYYRRQADAEAYALIRQKATDPRWAIPDATIEVKPESRMHDPFSADHPPLPPDDPTSAKLMQVVDDKPGYSHWHANGDTDYVESPDWRAYLPIDENGNVLIDSTRAVSLALTHSTLYQRQREELYLSALDVSLERFGFDIQGFWGFSSFYSHNGRLPSGDSSSTWDFSGTRTELSRLGATGSQLIIGMANSILWQFSGPDTQAANTLINFSFVQPLLRGGGRDVILESLTQAERTLLANVRQFERFRQGFFLSITTGRNAGTGPLRNGNFLGDPPTGSGNAGGLLGLLRAQQTIRIQEYNVSSLRNVLDQFIEFHRAERLDSLQLSQTESTLYSSQSRLLQLRNDYETQLDDFKRTLGLPPDLPVVIQDTFLKQFELIDDENNQRQYQISDLKVKVGNVLLEASSFIEANRVEITREPAVPDAADPALPADPAQDLELDEEYGIAWSDELGQKIEATLPLLSQIDPVINDISVRDIGRIRADIEYLAQVRPRRADALRRLREKIQTGDQTQYDIETGILEDTSLELPEQLSTELEELVTKLAQNHEAIEQLRKEVEDTIQNGPSLDPKELYRRLDEGLLSEIPKQLTDLASVSLEMSLVQARARTDSIDLAPVDLDSVDAIQIARCCRHDWMNARASLVDSWRAVEVVADDLESDLDLVFEGDIGNFGDNPFKIRYETGELRGGFRFDSPITRMAERNNYRQQLIQYQRDRRQYYEFEDAVKQSLRQTIRDIELNKILFELSRRSIKVSVQQVEQSRLRLEEPPQGIAAGARSTLGSTTARDLTDALNRLQNDQNAFLGVWVNYEALRRDLNFDLGTMQLSADGYWIDPGTIDRTIGIGCGAMIANDETGFPELPSPQEPMPVEIQMDSIEAPAATPPDNSQSVPAMPRTTSLGAIRREPTTAPVASLTAAIESEAAAEKSPDRSSEVMPTSGTSDVGSLENLSGSDDLFRAPTETLSPPRDHDAMMPAITPVVQPHGTGPVGIPTWSSSNRQQFRQRMMAGSLGEEPPLPEIIQAAAFDGASWGNLSVWPSAIPIPNSADGLHVAPATNTK